MLRAQRRVMGELRVRGSNAARLCLALAALTVAACSDDVAQIGDEDAGKVDAGYQHAIVEKTIDPTEGGKIELPAGPVLDIPAGALPAGSKVRITVETTQAQGPQGAATRVYQFGPDGLRFEKPVPISIPFDLTGRNAADYTMFWSKLGGDGYDNITTEFKDGKAMAMVEHFSTGGVRRKPEAVTCVAETSTPRDDDKDGIADGCTCKEGYVQRSGTCVDINECDTNHGGCDANVACTNTPGSHACGKCPNGYTGSGDTKCTDINECDTNNGGCDANVKCTNTAGAFTCGDCPSGFTGGGASGCVDIDECSNTSACDKLTKCSNTPGGYECATCPSGYLGNGKAGCTDANECAVANGGCDPKAICVNTPGSFSCGDCQTGYERKTAGDQCVDIDECKVNNDCGAHVACTNTAGGYECGGCEKGYEKKDGVCVNVNECADDTKNTCAPAHKLCEDNAGGYVCGACKGGWGYKTEGSTTCEDINECLEGGSGLSTCNEAHKACVNVDGAFDCGDCSVGYKSGPQGSCVSVRLCSTDDNEKAKACGIEGKRCVDQDHADATCEDCASGQQSDGMGGCTGFAKCADNNNAGGKECGLLHQRCVNHDNSKYSCEACGIGDTGDGSGGCRAVKKCANSEDAKVCADAHKSCADSESADLTCPACLTGWVYDGVGSTVCRAVRTCDEEVNGETGTEFCTGMQQKCVEHQDRDFSCELCADGQKSDGQGGCVPVAKCDAAKVAACAQLNKLCMEHASSDASCDACAEGFKAGGSEAVACVSVAACTEDDNAGVERCDLEGKKCSNHVSTDYTCGQCESGQKVSAGVCVPYAKCADLNNTCAAPTAKCVDHANRDYTCERCEPGQVSNGAGGCRAVAKCAGGGTAACETKNETCVDHDEADYTCGACKATFVRNAARLCVAAAGFDGCVEGEVREDLCEDQNRACEGGAGVDATCGACTGNTEEVNGKCVPKVDPCAAGQTVATMCEQMHVTCVSGACTTTCLPSFVKNAAGTCVAEASYDACAMGEVQYNICTPLHQTCMDSSTGNGGSCPACLTNYEEVNGACVDGCAANATVRKQCDTAHQKCEVSPGQPAVCSTTECLPYYALDQGACQPVDGCAVSAPKRTECDGAFKKCVGDPGTAPSCGDCMDGYILNGAVCEVDPMGCDSGKPIANKCLADHVKCEQSMASVLAACATTCLDNYEQVSGMGPCVGACTAGTPTQEGCADLNRVCDGGGATPASCGDCIMLHSADPNDMADPPACIPD